MKLKRLSLFLALVMILSAFAGTFTFASAEVAEDPNGAWEVNGKTYATLNDALSARESATTIYLIKDYAQSHAQVDINFNGDITIEGKGATEPVWSVAGTTRLLRPAASNAYSPNVTIRNLKMDDSQGKAKSVVQINRGTLTLDNVDIVCKNTGSGAVLACEDDKTTDGVTINIINGSTITATGDTAKTGTPSVGAIFLRGGKVTLNVTDSTIDASGYCAAIYTGSASIVKNITLRNATIKATSGVTYAVYTRGITTLYKLGATTITSGTSGETDALNVATALESKPVANTEAEADALAAARGYTVRHTDSALVALEDTDGDGYYFDGYSQSITSGINYLIADWTVTGVQAFSGNVLIDGQGHTITQSATGYRLFNTGAQNSNITFRNVTINGIGDGIIATKQTGCTYTLENVTVNYVGSYSLGALINVEFSNSTLNIIDSTINITAPIQSPVIYLHTNVVDTKVSIIDSTITKVANASNTTGTNVNVGLITNHADRNYTMLVKDSVIDYTECKFDWEQDDKSGTSYSRIIYKDQSPANSLLILENATLNKATGGNAPVAWYASSTLHMYGTNSITGGDRMFELAGGGKNSVYYLGGTATPSINTLDGAGIRTVKDSSGIRFISVIPADVMAGLLSSGTLKGYSFGTIVMKASDLEGTTVDAAIAAGKKYVDIKAKDGIVENADGSVSLYAALVNIKQQNLNVEFAGIAYIDLVIALDDPETTDVDEGVVVRVYSDYNAEDNARSITEVAKKALGDVKTTSSNELVDGFRYNNELAVGEKYYVDGVAKTVEEGDKLYSAYNADQRETIADYLA